MHGSRPGAMLRRARRRAGYSQRALAERTGVAQPTIARIERGVDDPRFSTVARLLAACGEALVAEPARGAGVDLSLVDELLAASPVERIRSLPAEVRSIDNLEQAGRRALRRKRPASP